MVESACKQSHQNDTQVDHASEKAQFSLVHVVVRFQLLGTSREDAVIKVDEDIGESHESENCGRWFALGFAISNLFLHELALLYNIV